MHVWALGLSCETPAGVGGFGAPGFHMTIREVQTCTFQAPALQTPPKFHEKTPRDTKRAKWWREREKKREILGPPPFGAPALRGPHPSGLPPFGAPTFSRFGPPPLTRKAPTQTDLRTPPPTRWPEAVVAQKKVWPKQVAAADSTKKNEKQKSKQLI